MTSQKLRIVFIGCVELSFEMLQETLASDDAEVVGIVSRESSEFHSDFRSLLQVGKEQGIPAFAAKGNDQIALKNWISDRKPDVVYCFGWPYLLGKEVLDVPRLGVVGYHPAALPSNRGRHPLIWAVALGLDTTASTFFFMDTGADSGDILNQRKVEIGSKDVGELYRSLIPICRSQVREFTSQLRQGTYERRPQTGPSNLWRKRGKADGQIDWRMSAKTIHDLVRALTRPYVGAHAVFLGQDCKIWRTEIWPDAPVNLEPGKVLFDSKDKFVVKCGEGAIRLIEHDFPEIPKKGTYL